MRINFNGDKTYIDILGSIEDVCKRISKRRLNNKINEFLCCRELIKQKRYCLTNIALEYYKQKGITKKSFPLLIKKNWIADKPIEINKVEIYRNKKIEKIDHINLKVFPENKNYVESIHKYDDAVLLEKRPTYKLKSILVKNNEFRFIFSLSDYFSYYNTCEVVSFEFCWAIYKKFKEKIPSKPLRYIKFPYRDNLEVFDFSNRGTAIGINTLLIVKNRKNKKKDYFYLHYRDSKKLAESTNLFHVVPAGTFQPDSFDDSCHERDFNLKRNILREFAEELLGKKELQNLIQDCDDFIEERPIKDYLPLFNKGKAKIFFLGFGLDPLTTKPEFLTCFVYDDSGLPRKTERDFTDNFEGKYFAIEFTKDKIKEYLKKEKEVLAAGRACLNIVYKHYEFFKNIF